MAIVSKETLKSYFQTGNTPTEAQWVNVIDTFEDWENSGVYHPYFPYLCVGTGSFTASFSAPSLVFCSTVDDPAGIFVNEDYVNSIRVPANSKVKFTVNLRPECLTGGSHLRFYSVIRPTVDFVGGINIIAPVAGAMTSAYEPTPTVNRMQESAWIKFDQSEIVDFYVKLDTNTADVSGTFYLGVEVVV